MNNEDYPMELILKLTEKQQAAIAWLIRNYDFAEELCMAQPLTEEQRQRFWKRANEWDDDLMKVLLMLEKQLNGRTEE